MQRFQGNAEMSEGWKLIGKTSKFDDVEWFVFLREPHNDSGWRMVKVVCDGRAPRKANYWLSWDGERFAHGREWMTMLAHRFELAKAVFAIFGGDPAKLKTAPEKPGRAKVSKKRRASNRGTLEGEGSSHG